MLLLLHLLYSAILEGPLDNVGLRASTLGLLARLERGPEVVEVSELTVEEKNG